MLSLVSDLPSGMLWKNCALHCSPASRLALKIMCDGNFTASLVSDDTAERRGLASLLTGGSVPGTLVLGSFHNAPPHERAKLAELLRPRPDGTAPLGGVRVVVVASRAIPEFDEPWITKIRVPPLRVRRPDLPAEVSSRQQI